MNRVSRRLVVVAFALASLSACEKAAKEVAVSVGSGGKASLGADGKITVKTDEGGTATIDTKDGLAKVVATNAEGKEVTATFGASAKLPEGFPLPAFAGMTIVQGGVSTEEGKKSYAVMGQVQKPANEVADFYEAELKKLGLKVTRTEATMGPMRTVAVTGEGADRSMNVGANEAGGQTTVTIGGEWR